MPWYSWLVFIAIQIAVIIWVRGAVKRLKSDQNQMESPDSRQEKLIRLYQQIEEMLDSFEEFVGEVHGQLDGKRAELIELNRQAQVIYLQVLEASSRQAEEAARVVYEPEAALPPEAPVRKAAAGRVIKQGEWGKKADGTQKQSRLSDRDKETLGSLSTKPQKVRFLMSRGMSLEEVARELDIGKGEVLLITDLNKS
jgi:membrane protein involved in colicin uptake